MSGETSMTNRSDEWGWSVRLHLMSPHITTHIPWKRYQIWHSMKKNHLKRYLDLMSPHITTYIPYSMKKISNMTFHIPWRTPIIQISHIATHHHIFYIYNTSPPNVATHQHPYSKFHEKRYHPSSYRYCNISAHFLYNTPLPNVATYHHF